MTTPENTPEVAHDDVVAKIEVAAQKFAAELKQIDGVRIEEVMYLIALERDGGDQMTLATGSTETTAEGLRTVMLTEALNQRQ